MLAERRSAVHAQSADTGMLIWPLRLDISSLGGQRPLTLRTVQLPVDGFHLAVWSDERPISSFPQYVDLSSPESDLQARPLVLEEC